MKVFYYIIMAFFGSLKGIVQLNLGSISTFQEVVVSFHKAPKRWWGACTSAKGKANLFRWVSRVEQGAILGQCKTQARKLARACTSLVHKCAHPAALPLQYSVCSAIDGLAKGAGTVGRKGSTDYAIPGVHVNQETLNAMGAKRMLDRQRLSHTERVLQNTQQIVKQTEDQKGQLVCRVIEQGGPALTSQPVSLAPLGHAPAALRLLRCMALRRAALHCQPPRLLCCARCAVLTYFEDSRVAMWLVFSDVWNAIVEELRAMDLVSDGERDNLVFVHLDIDQSIEVGVEEGG